jgi:hypothetical protein
MPTQRSAFMLSGTNKPVVRACNGFAGRCRGLKSTHPSTQVARLSPADMAAVCNLAFLGVNVMKSGERPGGCWLWDVGYYWKV